MKVEVAALGPNSPYGLRTQSNTELEHQNGNAKELCESRGGRPGLPVLNKPHGFCGREATLS